tara:strand:- start:1901 stop:2293 length:393 start_codon:yes stop_codon:yes gene_type:complete
MSELFFYGLLLHLVGDYVTQSDWMANEKTKSSIPALIHATVYSVPFLLIVDLYGFLIISVTHFFIDRFRLARYLVYAKNFLSHPSYWYKWEDCRVTGYHKDRPVWLAVWLLIVADNTLHICINTLVILLI